MIQLILHLFGDYFLQNDWMATNKAKRTWPCLIHCVLYTLPFLILTRSWLALLAIFASHFLLDRFALTRYIMWLKNKTSGYPKWSVCSRTGYFDERTEKDFTVKFQMNLPLDGSATIPPKEFETKRQLLEDYTEAAKKFAPRPLFVTVWLTIVSDNTLHLICNYVALRWLV